MNKHKTKQTQIQKSISPSNPKSNPHPIQISLITTKTTQIPFERSNKSRSRQTHLLSQDWIAFWGHWGSISRASKPYQSGGAWASWPSRDTPKPLLHHCPLGSPDCSTGFPLFWSPSSPINQSSNLWVSVCLGNFCCACFVFLICWTWLWFLLPKKKKCIGVWVGGSHSHTHKYIAAFFVIGCVLVVGSNLGQFGWWDDSGRWIHVIFLGFCEGKIKIENTMF